MNSIRVTYCSNCLTPSSRPRIEFDDNGICNACRHAEKKFDEIDWKLRSEEFLEILEAHRSKNGSWDCVVPWSGGKDSSAIAYKLKYEFGMNPLLVTYSPLLPTEVGIHNRNALIDSGFDAYLYTPNKKVERHLSRRFFIERGNPKVSWDAGINALPVRVAMTHNIKLVFYAEHGETEYGGKVLNKNSSKIRDFTEVLEHQIGDDPRNWEDAQVPVTGLQSYLYPDKSSLEEAGLTAYYFAYFNKWSMFENFNYIKEKINFRSAPNGRTSGTFTDFDSLDDKIDLLYYYMQYIKFGFGRCVRDASRFIQNNQLSRKKGLHYCHQFDHEYPALYLDEVLDYLCLNIDEFTKTIDLHRNPEIWSRNGNGWQLRHPLPSN